jgi:hypothetical protein
MTKDTSPTEPIISAEDAELSAKVASLKHNLAVVSNTEIKLKKLCTAVVKVALSSRTAQLKVLTEAQVYLENIKQNAPQTLNVGLSVVSNELTSLYEGVFSGVTSPSDIYLTSGVDIVRMIDGVKGKIQATIARLEPLTASGTPDEVLLLQKNAKFKSRMPDLSKKEFGFARVPVAFSFSPQKGRSSVGYLDQEMLKHLGFKSEVLDGYAMIYDQVVVGVTRDTIVDWEEVKDAATGELTRVANPKIVKERIQKFTADKPGMVVKKRPKTALDAAKELTKLLEAKTNLKYAFVSETSSGYKGASYFWIMPTRDFDRLSRAFPGGHVKLSSWGFAF